MIYKMKKVIVIMVIAAMSMIILSACSQKKETEKNINNNVNVEEATENIAQEELSNNVISVKYTEEDLESVFDESSAVTIKCEGTSASISGAGAKETDGNITITAAGTYIFTGSLSDGQIILDAGKEDTIRIVLDNFTISCSDSAAIYGVQSKKLILTLKEGTTNQINDGVNYTYENTDTDEPNAAIYTKDDLTINGDGYLAVNGNYNHGIFSKDALVIISGNIEINSVNDGLKGKDSVVVKDGTINIKAGGDGIQSNNAEDTEKGYVVLEGGVYNITASTDGIQAETILQITGGEYKITTGGGSANSSTDNKGNERSAWGEWNTEESTDSTSAKGIKAGTAVYIAGTGIYNIDSSDDAIHSNGNISILGGTININSGDDGIHADAELLIGGGVTDIVKSYEGLEGKSITINGGNIHVKASDDGINSAGGNDGSSLGQRQGKNDFSSDGDSYIRITDGYVYVDAEGDGIDANGNIYIDGGIILVDGPVNSENSTMDYDGEAKITGGIFIGSGSSGMAQTFSDTSSQNYIGIYYSSVQNKESLISLTDGEGNVIISYIPSKEYEFVLISSPEILTNNTYTLNSGGNIEGNSIDGYYEDGKITSSEKVIDIKISGISTKISDTGSEVNGSMGGQNRGGNKGGGRSGEMSQRENMEIIL